MTSNEENAEIIDNQISENKSESPEDQVKDKTESPMEDKEEPELTPEEKLQKELEEKDKEIASLKDKMLRLQAQAANDRKRFKADADRSSFETKKRFLKKVLDIRDNIDRALGAFNPEDDQHKSHMEGITMIANQFDDMLSLEGITEMKAKGEMYDLLKHEIVSRIPYNGPENRVIDVIQKGYVMDNKVLRVAKVVLSMKQPKEEPKEAKNEDKTEEKENKES